jgi:hypothetical protein
MSVPENREKARARQDAWRAKNKEHTLAYNKNYYSDPKNVARKNGTSRAWLSRNKPRRAAYARRAMLKKTYGLSVEQFEAMLASQGNVCALCAEPFGIGKWHGPHVDHDHGTGKVRGILHGRCNTGLGHFKDSPQLLYAACFYLQRRGK